MRPNIFFFFLTSLFAFSQPTDIEKRVERGTELFRSTLIEYFIHPDQLDKRNWKFCEQLIRHLVEKREDDFIDIRIERAFLRSEDTHIFRPIFIYADGQRYPMPAFKIMQWSLISNGLLALDFPFPNAFSA